MSNQTQQTPMNISPQNVAGNCTYKCNLTFNYPVKSCTATNSGNYLNISCGDSDSSVKFNNTKYNIAACYLYSPSLQLYNNQQTSGELMLMHNPIAGGKTLYVCIPLATNGTSGNASNIVSEIIDAVAKGAPSQGGSVNQGINDFTANDFIPLKEFYSYETQNAHFVAFGMQNAIYISQKNLNSLQKIIKPFGGIPFPSGPKLFVNKKGPIKGDGITSNDIYIDCQPTDSSEEETNEVVNIKANTNYDVGSSMANIFYNPIFLLILFAIVFIILLVGINRGLKYLSGGSVVENAGTSTK
jgi:carbonic anhydrase